VWLSAIWVPTGLIQAAEFVVSAALGLVIGLLRAPFAYAAAAYEESKPYSKRALFTGALMKGWFEAAEGSKKLFDRLVSGLKPAMNEKTAVTGRPTAKAAGAFLLARLVQLGWLIGVLVTNLTGIAFLAGVYKGIKAAFAPTRDRNFFVRLYIEGGIGDKSMEEQGVPALKTTLDNIIAEFEHAKVPYDKAAWTVGGLKSRGFYTKDDSIEVFGLVSMTARQAAVVQRWARLN
jgi:hypothetical protein